MLAALLAAALAAVSFALASAPAAAAGPVRVDRTHGVRFELDGRVLKVRLLPRPDGRPPAVSRRVWGKRIDAVCSPVFHPRSRSMFVRQIRRWPRGELELRYRFGRDISARVKWCVLEDGAEDVAVVSFVPIIYVRGSSADDQRTGRQLRRHIKGEAPSATWLPRVKAIVVTDGVITVSTDLEQNRRGRRVARRICALIRSSGAADPPPGGQPHTVLGLDDVTLRDCAQSR
jgi:hypothetical protein